MCRDTFYLDTLAPSDTVAYYALRRLAELFPAGHIAQVGGTLEIEDYARADHCTLAVHASPPAEILTTWEEGGRPMQRRVRNGWYTVGWRGQHLDLVCLQGMEQLALLQGQMATPVLRAALPRAG